MKIKIDVNDGKNIYFMSDAHFFHKKIILYDKRPFLTPEGEPDVKAMHQTIVTNWNSTVTKDDIVFYLGDLSMTRVENVKPLVDQLNGKIHFIMGNHDRLEDIQKLNRFESINDYVDLTIKSDTDHTFSLMHYPIYSHNRMSHGNYHLHGHCHNNLHHGESDGFYTNRRAMDVSCNAINYTPISYREVLELLEPKTIHIHHSR